MRLHGIAAMAVLALAASLALTPPASANLVQNGGFETGNLASWTQGGNTGYTGVDSASAHSGNYGAFFGPVGSQGTITQQVLPTVVGATYDFSFWLQNDGGSTTYFAASWDGNQLVSLSNAPSFGWTKYDYQVVATATSTPITFTFRQDPAWYHLDDVSVEQNQSVPEPSTFALLGLGIALAAGLRKRRPGKA